MKLLKSLPILATLTLSAASTKNIRGSAGGFDKEDDVTVLERILGEAQANKLLIRPCGEDGGEYELMEFIADDYSVGRAQKVTRDSDLNTKGVITDYGQGFDPDMESEPETDQSLPPQKTIKNGIQDHPREGRPVLYQECHIPF